MLLWVSILLVIRFSFVGGQCKVEDIQLKEDFDPYQFEGKWFLVSMTRLWGIDFSPRNFTNSTGRTSWGDNANKFFGRWSRGKNGSRSWGHWRRRGDNGTVPNDVTHRPGSMGGQSSRRSWGTRMSRGDDLFSTRQGESPTESSYPQGSETREGWLRKSDGTAVPTGSPTGKPRRPPGGRRSPSPTDGTQQGSWPRGSMGSSSRTTTSAGRRQRFWSSPTSAMSRRFQEVFNPKNFQMETAVRDDSNIDMFIVGEFFGRCIFTKGQGSIVDARNTAKLEVNFPVRWFLPCQPFWIVDTDYVGYSVVYFCLEILDDGTCDPDSATVWTFNRKLTGHNEMEMDMVKKVMTRLCVEETALTPMRQTEYCPIEDENVQNQRNSKPTIHCNNADQRSLRIALDSTYNTVSSRNNAAQRHSLSPKIIPSLRLITLLVSFLLCKSKSFLFL
ncbi:uncharacterized protein LOC132552109 [Ylistrum balloti]|uniref:uncharacterized protein LOC132552109 n=1 Tax=Ylistrum balloti TaxID=509963 RepID=UPI0029058814|nr:uncharacterized protein LOC132552109 [Ylistrum balloti]